MDTLYPYLCKTVSYNIRSNILKIIVCKLKSEFCLLYLYYFLLLDENPFTNVDSMRSVHIFYIKKLLNHGSNGTDKFFLWTGSGFVWPSVKRTCQNLFISPLIVLFLGHPGGFQISFLLLNLFFEMAIPNSRFNIADYPVIVGIDFGKYRSIL